MATCGFILSTGRTSTQNIAAIAAKSHPEALVEHEGLGPRYFSRRVFRRPGKFAATLGANVLLQRKLIDIEDAISNGKSYLDVGWPSYAWLPYFTERFANSLRFVHLVRNPFHVAASLTTHGLFVPEVRRGKRFQRFCMIHTGDPSLHYAEIAAHGENFSPFERNLFHWLELNEFMLELHDKVGFQGIFRFEELYQSKQATLPSLLDGLLGEADHNLTASPADKFQRRLPVSINEPNPLLVDAVVRLGTRLGYSEEELGNSIDVEQLNSQYSERRLQQARPV